MKQARIILEVYIGCMHLVPINQIINDDPNKKIKSIDTSFPEKLDIGGLAAMVKDWMGNSNERKEEKVARFQIQQDHLDLDRGVFEMERYARNQRIADNDNRLDCMDEM